MAAAEGLGRQEAALQRARSGLLGNIQEVPRSPAHLLGLGAGSAFGPASAPKALPGGGTVLRPFPRAGDWAGSGEEGVGPAAASDALDAFPGVEAEAAADEAEEGENAGGEAEEEAWANPEYRLAEWRLLRETGVDRASVRRSAASLAAVGHGVAAAYTLELQRLWGQSSRDRRGGAHF